MAHQLSGAELLGTESSPHQNIPRHGSKRREVYDLFMANKGIPINKTKTEICGGGNGTNIIEALNTFYGLDIRQIGHKKWVLAGEWFGSEYVDYIAQRVNAERERGSGAQAEAEHKTQQSGQEPQPKERE